MLKSVVTATILAMLVFTPMSQAKTPDGMTPAEETVCDDLNRALFGLCNAYCEAMDCHLAMPAASERACERVLTNYMTHSRGEMPPCHGLIGDDDLPDNDDDDTETEDDDPDSSEQPQA